MFEIYLISRKNTVVMKKKIKIKKKFQEAMSDLTFTDPKCLESH